MHDHSPGCFGFSHSKVIILDLIVPTLDNLSTLYTIIPLRTLTFLLERLEEGKVFSLAFYLHAVIVVFKRVALG